MNNLNLDKYLNIANEEKIKRGLETYMPLYPMLRKADNKLYVCVPLTREEDKVWEYSGNVKPEYWILIDIITNKIIEFNKTSDKDFVIGDLILKKVEEKQKEVSKYTVEKTLQYKEYLLNDIKNEKLPLQKKLSDILDDEMEIDGNLVNINEYIISNLEEDINKGIDELIKILIYSKYGSYTFYYDMLLKQIISDYSKNKEINIDKLNICSKIINNYYDGVIGIDNIFNIN